MSNDQRQGFLFEHHPIRGVHSHLSESWQQILASQDYPPTIRHLLGELVAAATLLASNLKIEGRLSIHARGNGPVTLLSAECNHLLEIRAVAKFTRHGTITDQSLAEPPELPALLGNASLAITIEPAQGDAWQGIVPLERGNLAACLEEYFNRSEQLATRLWLAADDHRAGGLMLQQLPDQTALSPAFLDQCVLADTITPPELLKLPTDTLLNLLFHEEDLRLFSPETIRFHCPCSRERTLGALIGLGRQEIDSILLEQGCIETRCDFCGTSQRFTHEDFADAFPETPGNTLQ